MSMRRSLVWLLACIVTIGVIGCSSATHSGALTPAVTSAPTPLHTPSVSKVAPDFALDTLDGSRKVHLSDFRSKTMVLLFWASTCSTCVRELSVVQRFFIKQQSASQPMSVLSIDIDRVGDFVSVTTLQERLGLTYPILVDDHFQVRSSYQITSVPVIYVLDRQHFISSRVSGFVDDVTLSKITSKVTSS